MANTDDCEATAAFYASLLRMLQAEGLPLMVGGAYGFAHYTGIRRPTKDLDIFVRQSDWPRLAQAAHLAGYRAELTFTHWLGKVHDDAGFVDVIFNSGNGLSPVDDGWFEHAVDAQLFGLPVQMVPAEESIWTKAFIMERERYDGADVAHLIHACAAQMDWPRLLQRFGPHWRVLLSHLVLYGFVYPGERTRVPAALMEELLERLSVELHHPALADARCAGTLLSREQYLPDVAQQGYVDVRLASGTMRHADVVEWTAAIPERSPPLSAPPAPDN